MPTRPPDFEAEVRFLTVEEGGRKTAASQGYRPDIHVDDDHSDLLWMIWPRFLDENGAELPDGTEVPQVCRAHFYIVNPELRRTVHRQWLRDGARFHLSEGQRRTAACRVTKILSLNEDMG
jgi:translation elongation factor EF-Tu-like GTPase